jgi:hypothetical protein
VVCSSFTCSLDLTWCSPFSLLVQPRFYLIWLVSTSQTNSPDDGDRKHLWNIHKLLADYTLQQPRRQPCCWKFTHGLLAHSWRLSAKNT